jgi:hypothetical protein
VPRPLSQLKPSEALLVRPYHRPQVVQGPDYLRDGMYRGLYAPNPFYYPVLNESEAPVLSPPPDDNVLPFPEPDAR